MRGCIATAGLVTFAAVMTACGGSSTPTPSPSATNSTSPTATATTPPVSSATPTPTPASAQLVIHEYGVAITLTPNIADATYRIDSTMATGATPGTDANGHAYSELAGVRIWTASLAADPACSSIKQGGLVAISVYAMDPSGLTFPSGPSNFKHVGAHWFGISQENAYACSDGNSQEWPTVNALVQAYNSLHPA